MLCDVPMRFDECNAMFAAFAMRWCGMVCDECVYVMLRLLCDVCYAMYICDLMNVMRCLLRLLCDGVGWCAMNVCM
jgi:hypothetical protein